jgi:hypothetical protein
LVTPLVRRFCSAPASIAPSLHARGRLPCIRTRLCKGEGISPCLATPWLLRVLYAQPSPSFRSFSFRLAMLHSHLCLREDRGLPVLGPCLPLLSPRQPLTSITRDPAAPVWIRSQPPYCSSSCTARDLPAHRRPARRATAPPLPAAGHALASASPRHICTCPSRAHP